MVEEIGRHSKSQTLAKYDPPDNSQWVFKKSMLETTYHTSKEIVSKCQDIQNRMYRFSGQTNIKSVRGGIYRIFSRNRRIKPHFSSSWLIPKPPGNAKELISYKVGDAKVTIYRLEDETEGYYHISPPEYALEDRFLRLLDVSRKNLMEDFPPNIQLSNINQAKDYVRKFGEYHFYELANLYDIKFDKGRVTEQIKSLSSVLARYTAGMGIIEIILQDPNINDIYIDAPAPDNLVYVMLGKIGRSQFPVKCRTNIILSSNDVESLLSRFRYDSGRPFSEAMPVLECDLQAYDTRVTVVGRPLSPQGTAFALRKHAMDPWTLTKLIDVGSLTPLAAGLLSFLIDGKATIIVTGSRGAGKTSLLGALLLEFPKSQRILTIEDTLELPGMKMQAMGYKVQSLFIQSTIGSMGERSAVDALKVSLRLGESAIVMGEVRGEEAKTLYEAMRAGTAGSSVLGTFHANSAKAVFERIVYDMGINRESFTATDVIVVAGLTRPSGIQDNIKRVTQIAEVRKDISLDKDEMFTDLMTYNPEKDMVEPTKGFNFNSELLQNIASSWNMSMEEVMKNINIRAKIKQTLVQKSHELNEPRLLGIEAVSTANNIFWNVIQRHYVSFKKIDYSTLYDEWLNIFERRVLYAQ
ncbi:MAG: type II/IV secretion system ATPase subunit [Candidatus Thermoplasmatota archaeon]|jgi:type IV secretory pathway ATPase VirB11/archaellum biosynthesis ATPase|nr:type II/IV secretion system ATPase subunit [Candidatus Thermoplasmatota archaeon]MDP7265119.1 type II/IV secretion system ATPase subunit [Candidatus Thermoplasmatota archaeon]